MKTLLLSLILLPTTCLAQSFKPTKVLEVRPQSQVVALQDGGYALSTKENGKDRIIFYSDGDYNTAKENPVLQSYLASVDEYLADCSMRNIAPRYVQQKVTLGHPEGVEPLTTCTWDQGSPYNALCPLSDGSKTLTGCVGTALAQVVRTLGAPVTLQGTKHYVFYDEKYNRVWVTEDLSRFTVDFDHLLDSYSGVENYLERKAIAELMYACGVAVSTAFTTGGSGSGNTSAIMGINTYFNGIHAVCLNEAYEDYEQRVYDELDAGRPLLYTGYTSSNGGHAFVIDGYNKSGYLHVNLGWSGSGNCYTAINNMSGFNCSQCFNAVYPDNTPLSFSAESPVDELKGKYARVDLANPVGNIEEGKWYSLYNVRYSDFIYSSGVGKEIKSSHFVPNGEATDFVAPFLVRFTKAGNGYNIQAGTGDYFGEIISGGNKGTTATPTVTYTHGYASQNTNEYHWFSTPSYCMAGNDVTLTGICGWGPITPSDSVANSSWKVYPVELNNAPFEKDIVDNSANRELIDSTRIYKFVLAVAGNAKYYMGTTYTGNVDNVPAPIRISTTASKAASFTAHWNGYGWEFKDLNDRYIGIGTTLASLGTEKPETWILEPTENENEFRMNNGLGYLGTDKKAMGAAVYRNKTADCATGIWRLEDVGSIVGIKQAENSIAPQTTYDLSGRRVSPSSHGITITNGKKSIKK